MNERTKLETAAQKYVARLTIDSPAYSELRIHTTPEGRLIVGRMLLQAFLEGARSQTEEDYVPGRTRAREEREEGEDERRSVRANREAIRREAHHKGRHKARTLVQP